MVDFLYEKKTLVHDSLLCLLTLVDKFLDFPILQEFADNKVNVNQIVVFPLITENTLGTGENAQVTSIFSFFPDWQCFKKSLLYHTTHYDSV